MKKLSKCIRPQDALPCSKSKFSNKKVGGKFHHYAQGRGYERQQVFITILCYAECAGTWRMPAGVAKSTSARVWSHEYLESLESGLWSHERTSLESLEPRAHEPGVARAWSRSSLESLVFGWPCAVTTASAPARGGASEFCIGVRCLPAV